MELMLSYVILAAGLALLSVILLSVGFAFYRTKPEITRTLAIVGLIPLVLALVCVVVIYRQ